jgi:hypothetical protein
VESEFAKKPSVEELYKPAQPLPFGPLPLVIQPATQYAQPTYTQQLPQQQQPYPPQPQPPHHLREEDLPPTKGEAVTKDDLIRALVELSRPREAQPPTAKPEAKAPPKPEVSFKEKIGDMLERHFADMRKIERGEDSLARMIEESDKKTEKLVEAIEKKVQEQVEERAEKAQPEVVPVPGKPPEIPQTERPPAPQPISKADVDYLIRQAEESARELAEKKVLEYLEAKSAVVAQEKPKESEIISQSEKPQEEAQKTPEEEPPAPIFPIFRRRRFTPLRQISDYRKRLSKRD